jgi:hypothetical protein
MYALQNQNVERKIVKKLDIRETSNNTNSGSTSVDELTNSNDIPEILIPNKEEDIFSHQELEQAVNNYENTVSTAI